MQDLVSRASPVSVAISARVDWGATSLPISVAALAHRTRRSSITTSEVVMRGEAGPFAMDRHACICDDSADGEQTSRCGQNGCASGTSVAAGHCCADAASDENTPRLNLPELVGRHPN